jgi:hypothetical protein
MRPGTVAERRRLYLLARLLVKRRYHEHLTLAVVAKTLASSPRQLQRAYTQFGRGTFREDLLARRMIAAADPQRSDGSGGATDGLRGICGGFAVPLRGVCGGRDHRRPANTGETTHVDPPCFGGFRPCLLDFAKH